MGHQRLRSSIRTWGAALAACQTSAQWQRALDLLEQPLGRLLDPQEPRDDANSIGWNTVACNAALSACQKASAAEIDEETARLGLEQGARLVEPAAAAPRTTATWQAECSTLEAFACG